MTVRLTFTNVLFACLPAFAVGARSRPFIMGQRERELALLSMGENILFAV